MGSSSSGFFPLVLTRCSSLGGAGWCFFEPRYFSLWLPLFLFLIIFLDAFQKLSWVLECLLCSIHTLILLAGILPFVYNNANVMLGNIVDSSSFAVVTLVGCSFLNSAYSLDTYNTTFLVDSRVCGQRTTLFSKRLREHIAGASLSLCVGRFGELLEGGGYGLKRSSYIVKFISLFLYV